MNNTLLESEPRDQRAATFARQALWFFLHTLIALAAWMGLMLAGYAVNPAGVSQWAIFALSMAVPLIVGLIVAWIHSDEMASAVWLMGVIWVMALGIYVLDLQTGPGQCLQCGATEKLTQTFFSWPGPSGLMDNDGPFVGTWPAVALVGYSIGAWLARRRKPA